ncbi:hypothetical protein HPB47_011308 [Ixodes persulcatus]|uniref:Uncharacterized protein n=1 Tax=Ixodes persulcatus TaxID=34615 RepID=A0AC60NWN9_IXOPE|nr:hypothetical protein HPB47_011308 [Ixodes persulcatus]
MATLSATRYDTRNSTVKAIGAQAQYWLLRCGRLSGGGNAVYVLYVGLARHRKATVVVSHPQSSLFSGDFPLQQVRGHPRSPLVSSSAFLNLAAWLRERNNRRQKYRV